MRIIFFTAVFSRRGRGEVRNSYIFPYKVLRYEKCNKKLNTCRILWTEVRYECKKIFRNVSENSDVVTSSDVKSKFLMTSSPKMLTSSQIGWIYGHKSCFLWKRTVLTLKWGVNRFHTIICSIFIECSILGHFGPFWVNYDVILTSWRQNMTS